MNPARPCSKLIIATVCLGLYFFSCQVNAQTPDTAKWDTSTIHKGRLTGLIAAQGTLYLGSLAVLYFAWYSDYPQSTFHLFNDSGEWLQLDKMAHASNAYYISRIGHASYRWAGLDKNRSIWFGGLLSFAYMLNIEILDGFSAGWGFSTGDLAANTAGCVIFMTQQFVWDEQRMMLKYSYHPTQYPQYRRDLLGENLLQNILKDYNGMTFWLSGNIHSFLPESTRFPRWLNVAIGYGAEGMTGSFSNPGEIQGDQIPQFTPYRKFFLSLDVDLTRIPTRSKVLKGIFNVLGFIKIPAPALEYNTLGQIKFYPIYF